MTKFDTNCTEIRFVLYNDMVCEFSSVFFCLCQHDKLCYNRIGSMIFPLFDPPDPLGSDRKKANENVIVKGGGTVMSKIIAKYQCYLDKVSGHKYTGCTIKTPFINFSFAPTIVPFQQ